MKRPTCRKLVNVICLSTIFALPFLATLSLESRAASAGELDSMSTEHFAHYARSKLRDLAARGHSVRTIAIEFDEKCRLSRNPRRRASDCEVAQMAHEHLDELMRAEVEIMTHLRRDGDTRREPWVYLEDREFWTQVGGHPPAMETAH